jgi:hypothetical protein
MSPDRWRGTLRTVTLGSSDSSRIARPGHLFVPRFGLLLGLLGGGLGVAGGCVDQPLIPVAGSPVASGGTTGGGTGAGGIGAGGTVTSGETGTGGVGWFGSGGNGQGSGGNGPAGGFSGAGGQSECLMKTGSRCVVGSNDCCPGLLCPAGQCCIDDYSYPCSENSECCGGSCVYNQSLKYKICVTQPRVDCNPVNSGEYCKNSGACCSNKCRPSYGSQRCMAIEGCSPIGEYCFASTDCCTGICDYGRCQAKPESGLPTVGEICDPNFGCQTGSSLVCADTPEPDIQRCKERTGNPGTCVQLGSACLQSVECCRTTANEDYGHCLPPTYGTAANGKYGTCQACREAGQYCKSEVDCCSGYSCNTKSACVAVSSGTGGSGSGGGSTSSASCAMSGQYCSGASSGSGGASGIGNTTSAPECCSGQGLVCDQSQSPARCAPHS